MINPVAVEALYSATYVENYLDSVENLPDDVQKHLSRIREIDVQYRAHIRDVDNFYELWSSNLTNNDTAQQSADATVTSKRNRAMTRMQQNLIAAQELGDEKLHIVTQLQELIDQKTRQLEQDFSALDYGKKDTILESSLKDVRPITPAVSSPISSTAPTMPFASSQSVISSSNVTSITTPNDRYSAASNSTSAERSNKRARRTRNDNSSGMDNNQSSDQISTDIMSKSASSNAAAQSSGGTQKKNNSSGGNGAGGSATNTNASGGKKKKRKSGRQANNTAQASASRDNRDDTPPVEEAIDPDEPTYCLCDQISFGEMILCDNDLCPIEWFHFSCVSLMSKPKGKWFCPNCRGERPNVMKPKAQFLKELERYNKEKEEKT